jgi:hypothetical protein
MEAGERTTCAISTEIDREVERVALRAGLAGAFMQPVLDYDLDDHIRRIARGEPSRLADYTRIGIKT